jgi:hypothetical protein
MAQKVTVLLTDDLDGGEASQTVNFGLDGSVYEIDLNDKNATGLRSVFQDYIDRARKGHAARRGAGRSIPQRQHSAEVRAWARTQGVDVSERGRIPATVVAQFEAAQRNGSRPVTSPEAAAATAKPSTRGKGGKGSTAAAASSADASAAPPAIKFQPGIELTVAQRKELAHLAEHGKPSNNLVTGKLAKVGLADRDTNGRWWVTDQGKAALA